MANWGRRLVITGATVFVICAGAVVQVFPPA